MSDPPDFTEAFPALYRRSYAVGFRLLGRAGPAEDIAQEALARAIVVDACYASAEKGAEVTL